MIEGSALDRSQYFDNAATTPVDPRVVEAMLPFFAEHFGNANSLHQWGRDARAAVELAREQIAELLGAEDPEEIVFTSGATESNNWILRSFSNAAVSPFEHSSALATAKGLGIPFLPNSGYDIDTTGAYDLVSVMKLNNEIGCLFEPESIARTPRLPHSHTPKLVHSDVTQAVGKLSLDVSQVDFASFSAHKFYGPKGVGALYAKGANFPAPLLFGGEHEHGLRAGTLNVPAIVGMGAAAAIAQEKQKEDFAHAADMRRLALDVLQTSGLEVMVHERKAPTPDPQALTQSPFILSVSFLGLEGETLVLELDRVGFAISSGAACSAGSTEPSHVLSALDVPSEWLRGTVRISFGRFNTLEAAEKLAISLSQTAKALTKL